MAASIVVIEDNRRIREAIALVLDQHTVHAAATAAHGLALVDEIGPDVVLVDLHLPDMDGVHVLAELARQRPRLPALVLTVADSEDRILAAIRAGARGYLLKEDLGRRLATAIDEVLTGGVPLSPPAARVLLERLRAPLAESPPPAALTTREHEVLERLARSLTYDEVARDLGISVNTVRVHVRALYDKLDVSTRTEAVITALERGLLARDGVTR